MLWFESEVDLRTADKMAGQKAPSHHNESMTNRKHRVAKSVVLPRKNVVIPPRTMLIEMSDRVEKRSWAQARHK